VIVLEPQIKVWKPTIPGPQLRPVITVRVLAHPELNLLSGSTKKTHYDLSVFILGCLHKFYITSNLWLQALEDAAEPVEVRGLLGYDCFFEGQIKQNEPGKCGPVTIALGGGNITMTCATSGAEIWYTSDGSFPYQGTMGGRATTAAKYTAPFASVAGKTYWACAFKTGTGALLSGDVAELLT